jgi:hypothetical protein
MGLVSDFEVRHLFQLYASQRLRPTVNLSGKLIYGTGMPVPGFFEQRAADVFLSTQRNRLRLPDYQRTDLRVNKLVVKKRFQDARTGRARIRLERSFPILPSAGIVADF